MTVEQVESIDFIGVDKKKVSLLIVDHLEWGQNDENHLFLLQEKVNAYLRFFESGEIYRKYPNSRNRDVELEIVFNHLPSKKGYWFLDQLQPILARAGVKLLINTSKVV